MVDEASVVPRESWENDAKDHPTIDETHHDNTTMAVRPWSECLTSPGGTALQLTCDKAKQLTHCNRQAAIALLETTRLFDAYAKDLQKAADTLDSVPDKFVSSIQQLTVSFSAAYSQLSNAIKSIALPLQGFLGASEDANSCLHVRYQNSRRTAEKARQKALTARAVYTAIHKEVATNLDEWKKGHNDGDDPNKRPPEKIVSQLSQLQACESRYKHLVQCENGCVRQRQRLEVMALESMQKIAEDRFVVFVYSLIKLFAAAGKDAVSIDPARTASETCTVADSDAAIEKKCDNRAVRNLSLGGIIMTTDDEEKSGVMDAETLGLPIEIGQLRDQALSLVAVHTRWFQTARALACFLDSVEVASMKLGNGLKQHHSNGYESVREAMATIDEGPRAIELWNGLSQALWQEGSHTFVFAEQVKILRIEKLEHATEFGKILNPASQRDNATWKQLCDAARSQAKAEDRYREATEQKAKARNRCKSVETDSATGASLGITAGKHMSQSLANMFAILPNGGEHAMKVLDLSTRSSMAQLSLEEADQKEAKERQLFNSATELTALSLEAYKSSAVNIIFQCNNNLPEELGSLVESLAAFIAAFQVVRQNSLRGFKHLAAPRAWLGASSFLNALSLAVQRSLKLDHERIAVDPSSSPDHTLSVHLEQSELVQRTLRLLEVDPYGFPEVANSVLDDVTESEAYDEGLVFPSSPLARERTASASSVLSIPKSPVDESRSGWLLRSLTMPDTDSIFGKLTQTKKSTQTQQSELDIGDTETSIFVRYFWHDDFDRKSTSHIIGSFACSFKDGASRFPSQYGRIFISIVQLTFVGWTQKQLSLKWDEVVGIEPVKNSLSSANDSLVVKCRKKGSTEESYMVLNGFDHRQQACELIDKVREQTKAISVVQQATPVKIVANPSTPDRLPAMILTADHSLGVIPSDETLKKMVGIVSGRLCSISIHRFYEIIWSEGNGTNEKPFYQPWLEKECFDAQLDCWQVTDVTGPWCGEHYNQRREVRFKVKRKSHLYIGPPIANVVQTQYCRVEGNDRCVVQMRVAFSGIPYGDSFTVEIRWVATREEERDIKVEVGVEVSFTTSTFLKNKIRSGAIEESAVIHKNLFEAVQAACATAKGFVPEVEPAGKVEIHESVAETTASVDFLRKLTRYSFVVTACGILVLCASLWRSFVLRAASNNEVGPPSVSALSADIAALSVEMKRMATEMELVRETLTEILSLIKKKE